MYHVKHYERNCVIDNLISEIHKQAVDSGFYDNCGDERDVISRQILLVITELCESVEAYRKHGTGIYINNLEEGCNIDKERFLELYKDTFVDEIADTLIRVFDLLGYLGISIYPQMIAKLKYNKTRGYKHGKRF